MGRGETSNVHFEILLYFCNCLISRQGSNLSTANQPVYMQDMASLYISGSFARSIPSSVAHFCVQPLDPSARLSPPECGGRCRSLAVKVVGVTIGHLAVVSVALAKLPRGNKKYSQVSSCLQAQVPPFLNEHTVVYQSPRNKAPKRQSNHDMASAVISDLCLFANSVASPHRVIAPPRNWVHSRLVRR